MCRRQRGLTLLEFALVVVFMGLLMWLAMTKILRLEADVERVNVQRTVAALNSALAMEFAERVVDSRLDTVPELAGSNPMERLAQVPHNYLGPAAGSGTGMSWRDTGTTTRMTGCWSTGFPTGIALRRPWKARPVRAFGSRW
jgi:hypothetical protein